MNSDQLFKLGPHRLIMFNENGLRPPVRPLAADPTFMQARERMLAFLQNRIGNNPMNLDDLHPINRLSAICDRLLGDRELIDSIPHLETVTNVARLLAARRCDICGAAGHTAAECTVIQALEAMFSKTDAQTAVRAFADLAQS